MSNPGGAELQPGRRKPIQRFGAFVRDSTSKLTPFLALLLVLSACTLAPEPPPFQSPPLTPPLTRAHFPMIADGPIPATTPKKGVSLWTGSCDLLRALGASWYYAGRECDTADLVPYLDHAANLELAPTYPPPPQAYVMFWNEPDLPRWETPPLTEAVRLFRQVEAAWPDKVWVGPCLAGNLGYLRAFWTEYQRQTGQLPDKSNHRLCLHCYAEAAHCINATQAHLITGADFGLDTIWLTEFGMPLGLYYSIDDARKENGALVAWLEANPQVERYAYWSAMIPHYGYTVPGKPISGFNPLAYIWISQDARKLERLTDMGEWYATAGGN
jgi:hypothetical protein